jgi:hypothetical protein
MSADRADEENLKATSFTKGEWIESEPVELAMDYDSVAETFATAGVPLGTITPLTLLALAYVTGGLDSAVTGKPDDLLTEWEAAITARGAQAGGGDAAANARASALTSCTSEAERMAVRLVEAKDGVMQLVNPLRELPLVQTAALNVQLFKRLSRLADAHGSMPTARIRSLAVRLGVTVPDDNDSSETGRAQWVWQLALLERSITIRALGYLKAAQADGKWDQTVAALSDTGRFTAPWMAAARAAKTAATAAAAAAVAAGTGFQVIPILDYFAHVATAMPSADANALAKQFAYATAALHRVALTGTQADVWKTACGMAMQRVMRERNHGLDRLPAMPAAAQDKLSTLLLYMFPPEDGATAAATTTATTTTATTAPTTTAMSFDEPSLAALKAIATSNATAADKKAPIVLGNSKVADGGTLRRPEYFSACDVAVFEEHEARLTALSEVKKGEDLMFTAALHELPEQARDLLAVPVNPADMAKNKRLLVLQVLQLRQTTVADNIIIQGTALSNERETEEERKEDEERATALRWQKQGDFIKGGPQLCVVTHRLDSLWTFLQIPYSATATAAKLNGSWDTTWFTWAKSGHAQLGPECEVIPGAQ